MMSNQPLPVQATEVPALVGKAARLCGGLLNSVMVVIGDRLGLYKTGQLRFD
jgi:hypothetical protein